MYIVPKQCVHKLSFIIPPQKKMFHLPHRRMCEIEREIETFTVLKDMNPL